mmetsp:Transcript_30895/g.67663  ORF Transcript_30895/g.67663 Transcript_30895/m.67663 type:complete len:394 (+) Transcript_30895:103-1284(+)
MNEAPAPGTFLFASESVSEGHPDKLCDRVADAVLDACLQDSEARVSCEACSKTGMVMVLGEVLTKASVNFEQVIREAVRTVGYDSDDKGLDWRTMNVIVALDEHSPDLLQVISTSAAGRPVEDIGVDDQGVVFGYASDESPELMPMSHVLATRLSAGFDKARKEGLIPWARPDARAKVVVEYKQAADGSVVPLRIHSVAMTTPPMSDTAPEQVEKDLMEHVVKPSLPEKFCDSRTSYSLVPPKQAAIGSVCSDTGVSGKKIGADTYGGWGSFGDSISGKDASKLSRSAAYGARWAARSLVSSKLCKRCVVQLSYSPGVVEPVSVHVTSFGTAEACGRTDAGLVDILLKNFDFRPGALQKELGLKAPVFQKLSAHGHFGRGDIDAAWEVSKELK